MKLPIPLPSSLVVLPLLLLSQQQQQCNASSSQPSSASATKSPFRDVIFASPLKTLTVYDNPTKQSSSSSSSSSSPRARFLKRFKGGLASEQLIRRAILGEERQKKRDEEEGTLLEEDDGGYEEDDEFIQSSKWAEFTQALEDSETEKKMERMAQAFEKGFNAVKDEDEEEGGAAACYGKSRNEYQFVGVVMPHKGNKVKWYARKKANDSDWSVRMVHVDKAAVLRDLFVRGKIDVYGQYKNNGIPPPPVAEGGTEAPAATAMSGAEIAAEYTVKERSWRTLWNFSPKHFFTDRSGMFWRERRIRPGIYTDGQNVFESTYRYIEGKNGMKQMPGVDLSSYLDRYTDGKEKENILNKVQTSPPDVVAES